MSLNLKRGSRIAGVQSRLMLKRIGGAAVVSVAALVVYITVQSSTPGVAVIDLVERFPFAVEHRPSPRTFSLADITISGRTKPAIVADSSSRLVYTVTVPARAQLKVSYSVLEDSWSVASEGVLFRILISTSGSPGPDLVFSRQINPSANVAERAWQDVTVDLSPFSGDVVRLFLNTNVSSDALPRPDGRNGGRSAWGAPRIVTR